MNKARRNSVVGGEESVDTARAIPSPCRLDEWGTVVISALRLPLTAVLSTLRGLAPMAGAPAFLWFVLRVIRV